MDINKRIFSDKLKRLMGSHNKSRYDLSNDLKISYTTICDWVNGNVIPRSKKLNLLSSYFGVSVSYFFNDDEHLHDLTCEDNLIKAIKAYTSNKYQEELLTKCSMLTLDNSKIAIEQINYLLYKQEKEEEKFKWLDKYDDRNYDK